MFKLWSEINQDSKIYLKPDLGLRSWGELTSEEKEKIWHYLDWYFFDAQIREQRGMIGNIEKKFYEFYGEYKEKEYKQKTVYKSILYLNENYKAKSFADSYLRNPNLNTACYDFHNIFMKQEESVVMELLSVYAKFLYEFTKNDGYIYKSENEIEKDFLERKIKAEYNFFDNFSNRINDVFLQFGIKYYLTRDGFVPRQDEKIIEEIYEPVLNYLSNQKWEKVNEILSDAFSDYGKDMPQGYSGCVTKTISAIEAFLQILVDGKTGGATLSLSLVKAQKNNLIPSDVFTQTIFKNINSILSRERKSTGDAHPKDEYATEKNARMILNLAMIFMQHCIQ
ncbi:MAG: hypothetical protein WC242_01630 [Candidatus Paceibacterota bacterium]|jgi:hypothetical protein